MKLKVSCDHCKGGKVKEVRKAIAPGMIPHHVEHHRGVLKSAGVYLDQVCDCPRVETKVTRPCIICGGSGIKSVSVQVPKPGDRVVVRDVELLKMLGLEDCVDKPGTILTINDPPIPAAQLKDLPKDLRVTANVTWLETNKKGKVLVAEIKKHGEITTYSFTPTELRWVT
jgi:hypothetical protein